MRNHVRTTKNSSGAIVSQGLQQAPSAEHADSPWMPLFVGGAFIFMLAFNALFLLAPQSGLFVSLQLGMMGLSFLCIGLEFIFDSERVRRFSRHGMGGDTSPVPLGRVITVVGAGMIAIALGRAMWAAAF